MLREGNVSSADDCLSVLDPIVACYRHLAIRRFFRGDAAFARPELYEYLEPEGYLYAIRLPANAVLQREIEPFLTRPVGRPPNRPIVWYHDFRYQAGSWNKPRRVVAKIEWHKGELFPRVGFIVTNLRRSAHRVVKFYNGRGTAEQWIKEGKNAVKWTRLSCHDFADNQVRLSRCPSGFALAYNLGNFLRRLALPRSVKHWSLIPMYIGTSGEAHQDRSEGRHARPIRHFPDGRGRRAPKTVPGDPGAHSTAATTRDGAGMTTIPVETAREGGGDGDGLRGSTMNASAQTGLGGIMAGKRPDPPRQSRKGACWCLLMSPSVIESSERLAVPARRDRPKAIREIPARRGQ